MQDLTTKQIKAKEHYQSNKDKIKTQIKDYYTTNKHEILSYAKAWREKNKDHIKQKAKEYRIKNADKIKAFNKSYKEKTNYNSIYTKNRLSKDTTYKLKRNIASAIYNSLKSKNITKNDRTKEILGCSFEAFKFHLESKFESWMNWDNYGKYNGTECYGWDIDHIIPTSSACTEDEVIRLNHYSNLQPLCSYINRVVKRAN